MPRPILTRSVCPQRLHFRKWSNDSQDQRVFFITPFLHLRQRCLNFMSASPLRLHFDRAAPLHFRQFLFLFSCLLPSLVFGFRILGSDVFAVAHNLSCHQDRPSAIQTATARRLAFVANRSILSDMSCKVCLFFCLGFRRRRRASSILLSVQRTHTSMPSRIRPSGVEHNSLDPQSVHCIATIGMRLPLSVRRQASRSPAL